MKPHKHAELIKLWADGAEIEGRDYPDAPWVPCHEPTWNVGICEYRVKPAAPKWPQTTMTCVDISNAWGIAGTSVSLLQKFANKVLDHECSNGTLVPAAKVRVIEAKARAEGKREGMNPVHVIEAAWRHMKLGRLDPETIQIILLQAAK